MKHKREHFNENTDVSVRSTPRWNIIYLPMSHRAAKLGINHVRLKKIEPALVKQGLDCCHDNPASVGGAEQACVDDIQTSSTFLRSRVKYMNL